LPQAITHKESASNFSKFLAYFYILHIQAFKHSNMVYSDITMYDVDVKASPPKNPNSPPKNGTHMPMNPTTPASDNQQKTIKRSNLRT